MAEKDQHEARRTAHHEAGHFVASYTLSPSSYRATLTIRPDREAGTLGMARSESPQSREDHVAEVVGYFAGYAAERRFDPNAGPEGSRSDDESAREILVKLGEERSEDDYRARADTVVLDNWAAIQALAEELLDLGEVRDPFEAELIIDIARGETPPHTLQTYREVRASQAGSWFAVAYRTQMRAPSRDHG